MQQILQTLSQLQFAPIEQPEVNLSAGSEAKLSAINPTDFTVNVADGATLNLFVFHGEEQRDAAITINLGRDAKLNLNHALLNAADVNVTVSQAQGATSKVVGLSLSDNRSIYDLKLEGPGASSSVDTLQLGSGEADNSLQIFMRHMSSDCNSRSLSKCVTAGASHLKFKGLVYVAKDAQRTAAEQNCRGIELSDNSHIELQPQLEIYADDVKCSHGATMGQINSDAILYMRQRGLSEAQARRVQIEGFITDVVNQCGDTELCDLLRGFVAEKLETM